MPENDLWLMPVYLIIGWLLGAIVNWLSDVLPYTRRPTRPVCLHCQAQYSILDYLFLRPCKACSKSRNRRAWIVQVFGLLVGMWYWWAPPERLSIVYGLILLTIFGVIMVIDLEYRLILHPVSIMLAVIGLWIGIDRNGITSTLLGGASAYGVMFGLYLLGEVFVKFLSKRRGVEIDEPALGFGDVNLAGGLGLLLGFPGSLVGLLIGVLIGGVGSLLFVVAALIRRNFQAFTPLAYGPYLVLAVIYLLFIQ